MKNYRNIAYGQEKEPLLERMLAVFRHSHTIRFLKKVVQGKTLVGLDVGCGHKGEFVAKINAAAPNLHFFGCDIKVAQGDNNLFVCNIDEIVNISIKPDVVVMHAVMEHLESPSKTLRDIHSLLPKGGYFIITVPSPQAKRIQEFLAFKLGILSKKEIKDHKHYWNKKSFKEMLDSANPGFRFIAHRYFQFGLNNWVVLQKT